MRQRAYFTYFKILFRAIFWGCLLLLGSWLPLIGSAPTASAHAFVIGSDPVDGSTVGKAPSVVRIYFDAPIAPNSQADVYAFAPGVPASGLLVNAGQSYVNPHNPRELDTALLPASKLPQGGYEVRWSALSLTDGHTTSGLIGFNLGQSSTGAAGIPLLGPSTSNYFPQLSVMGALAMAWDWLVLLALLFWVGILLTEYFIVPRSASTTFLAQLRKHAMSLQALCLAVLLVGESINLILRTTTFTATADSTGVNLHSLDQLVLSTNYGRFWLARVALLLLALGFLGWKRYRQRQFQDDGVSPASTDSRASKRFSQLRQEASQGMPARPAPTPLPARSQARVTGAVAVPAATRGTTAGQARITTDLEAPAPALPAWRIGIELALVGLVMLTLASSNEITQLAPLPISATVLTWLGLAAQGIWFGCLAYTGLALLPLLPAADPDHHAETLVRVLKRALPWLLAAIGVLLVSDLFLGETTLQTPEQLLNDSYGRAFLVRLLLLLLLLIFTAYTFFFLLPRLQRQTVLLPVVDAEMPARRTRQFALEKTERTIRRALHALAGLAATTLICVALMNFFAPPVVFPKVDYSALTNPANTGGNPTSVGQTQHTGDLTATLHVLPARVGVTNTLVLAISDAQGQAVTSATVKLSINMQIMDMGAVNATMQRQGDASVYVSTFNSQPAFSMAGPWSVQIEIERPDQHPVHLTFQVVVAG